MVVPKKKNTSFRESDEYRRLGKALGETMRRVFEISGNENPHMFSLFTEADALEEMSLAAYRLMKLTKKEMGK